MFYMSGGVNVIQILRAVIDDWLKNANRDIDYVQFENKINDTVLSVYVTSSCNETSVKSFMLLTIK